MRRQLVFFCGLVFGLMAAQPLAARTVDDCEKIKEWQAYNACLASFGPSSRVGRGQRSVSNQPRAAGPEGRVYGRSRQAQRRAAVPGVNVQRVSGGRVRATFDVSAPRRGRTP